MSYRYPSHQQLRLLNVPHHQRVNSSPDVPFSWEMSPGVSKQHGQSGSRRHSSVKLQDHLAADRLLHRVDSGSFDEKELLPNYLAEENARRAIGKPPLRPPPYLTSSPRVSSPRSELGARAPQKIASKFGGRKSGGTDADPFLAAYIKCTTKQQAAKRKSAGFGFSCKSSVAGGVREDVLVRIPRSSI